MKPGQDRALADLRAELADELDAIEEGLRSHARRKRADGTFVRERAMRRLGRMAGMVRSRILAIDALTEQLEDMEQQQAIVALQFRNIRMLATRLSRKDPETGGHFLRFCEQAGFGAQDTDILRSETGNGVAVDIDQELEALTRQSEQESDHV